MFFTPLILAAGSLPTLISGAPVPSFPSSLSTGSESTHSLTERSAYIVFGGNGHVSSGWPTSSDWVTNFEQMFEANKAIMKGSCAQWNVPNPSDKEINHLFNSIRSVASSTGVDPRFVLAVVMQESNGCVRAPTSISPGPYPVINRGLMQSHQGPGSCNNNGQVLDPCPASEIHQMIVDGAAGTSQGAGLQQCLAQVGGSGVVQYYRAARQYNSGSVAPSGNLGQGGATSCYASDIANRLLGWSSGPSSCQPSVIGQLTSALSSIGHLGSGKTSSTSTATPAPTETNMPPSPASTSSLPPSPAPVSASTTASAAPIYPHAVSSCQAYDTVQSGDYCITFDAQAGITLAQLRKWNPGLDSSCSNLWLGYQYCVKA